MKRTIFNIFILCFILLFVACKKETISPNEENNTTANDTVPEGTSIAKGLFILNEGTFTYANSSLSFYDPEVDTFANNLFYKSNNSPLGDVANSMMIDETGMYIVVNNSKYIYKVDPKTLKYKAKLDGLTSPRHIISLSEDKAYVSDLESTGLWVINPSTMEKTGFIELGNTTEKMLRLGKEVIVTNWSNFYQPDTSNGTIQFVDIETNKLVGEVRVTAEPNAIVLDKDNNVWVLCSGGYMPPFEPALFCINPATRQVIRRFDFAEGDYPSSLAMDSKKETLYFLNGGFGTLNLYKMSIYDQGLPTDIFINSQSRVFSTVAVSPHNGDIYITDVKDYVQNGDVLRYTSDGEFVSSFKAGIVPGFMMFN